MYGVELIMNSEIIVKEKPKNINMENLNTKDSKICFCTLALGEKYCNFAMDLARDLEKYSPDKELLILTSKRFC